MPRIALRRTPVLSVIVACTAVVVSSAGLPVAGGAAPAAAATAPSWEERDSGRLAAAWAAGQLAGGDHVEESFGADAGLTADVVLALALTETGGDTATDARRWLERNARTYVSPGRRGDVSAGAVAKLILVATATGKSATEFGPYDLPEVLASRMNRRGRYTDSIATTRGGTADNSNMFTQSLALLALRSAGERVPPRAVRFLLGQRCTDGGYPVFYPSRAGRCTGDVDATGIAAQALAGTGRTADAVSAVQWLLRQQRASGSFANSGPGATPNANSTAIALQALLATGNNGNAAEEARTWLAGRQVGCNGAAADRGAIGYVRAVADGSALRATTQAAPALHGSTLADLATSRSASTEAGLPSPVCAAAPTDPPVAEGSAPSAPPVGPPAESPASDLAATPPSTSNELTEPEPELDSALAAAGGEAAGPAAGAEPPPTPSPAPAPAPEAPGGPAGTVPGIPQPDAAAPEVAQPQPEVAQPEPEVAQPEPGADEPAEAEAPPAPAPSAETPDSTSTSLAVALPNENGESPSLLLPALAAATLGLACVGWLAARNRQRLVLTGRRTLGMFHRRRTFR